jgi:hypothetical protein
MHRSGAQEMEVEAEGLMRRQASGAQEAQEAFTAREEAEEQRH